LPTTTDTAARHVTARFAGVVKAGKKKGSAVFPARRNPGSFFYSGLQRFRLSALASICAPLVSVGFLLIFRLFRVFLVFLVSVVIRSSGKEYPRHDPLDRTNFTFS
jgi:hypothetical protein